MKLINIMASSLDGCISSRPSETHQQRKASGFISADDEAWLEEEFSHADAIICSGNTLRTDDSAFWKKRNKKGKFPVWVIFTHLGLDINLPFCQAVYVPKIFISNQPINYSKIFLGSETQFLVYGSEMPGHMVVEKLKAMGIDRTLLFGGGSINSLFYSEGLVDELYLTICPTIVGFPEAQRFIEPSLQQNIFFSLQSSQIKSNHIFLKYKVEPFLS